MVRLTRKQREVLVDKVPDIANLVAGSMFFGQFLTERPFSVALAIIGGIASVAFWALVLALSGSET